MYSHLAVLNTLYGGVGPYVRGCRFSPVTLSVFSRNIHAGDNPEENYWLHTSTYTIKCRTTKQLCTQVQIDEARHNEKIGYGITAGALILLIILVAIVGQGGGRDNEGIAVAIICIAAIAVIGIATAIRYWFKKTSLIKKLK